MSQIGHPKRIITVTPFTTPVPQREKTITPVREPVRTPEREPVKV